MTCTQAWAANGPRPTPHDVALLASLWTGCSTRTWRMEDSAKVRTRPSTIPIVLGAKVLVRR